MLYSEMLGWHKYFEMRAEQIRKESENAKRKSKKPERNQPKRHQRE